MSDRIPIRFDRALRPEWLDFALQQSVRCPSEASQRQVLREYLGPQIVGKEALDKTITQLQRIVGSLSPVSPERLGEAHTHMECLAPDQRAAIRLSLLTEASPFFADCVAAIRKMGLICTNGFTTGQVIDLLISKYGDRAVVPRSGQRVLQTLALMGALVSKDGRWSLIDVLDGIHYG